jgi:hypothetical protein
MPNQIALSNQLITPNVVSTVQQLSTSLKTIQPISLGNSEKEGVYSELSQTTQLITYTLIATAIVGIFVYHYIKTQEQTN